jgi:two-component sensor histidine kinase
MGTKLITNFVRQIGGQPSLQNDEGAVFSLTVPLEAASQPAN